MKTINIGEKKLLSFFMEQGWKKKELYDTLIDEVGSKVMAADQRKYGRFFLKIKGMYDNDIIPVDFHCSACPYNYNYSRYNDYNILRDDKLPVLVLVSDYIDFKDYDIFAAYFTDKPDEDKSDNVELWGSTKGIMFYIRKLLGLQR